MLLLDGSLNAVHHFRLTSPFHPSYGIFGTTVDAVSENGRLLHGRLARPVRKSLSLPAKEAF